VVALPTPDAKPDARGDPPDEKLRLLRELGAQAVPAWAAVESLASGERRIVVVERAHRKAFEDPEIADWIRDARRLKLLDHPSVARIRDVAIRSDEVLFVIDFVDGVRWSEWCGAAPPPPLEIALRVFVDALSGLGALHNLRDERREPLRLAHGGLTPDCIVVGADGVSRVVSASRPRSAAARLAGSGSAYLAPEVLLEDDSADARADVYSVGVMLWEALSQRHFLPNLQPSAIVTQRLGGRLPPAIVPEATPWAAPLADVVSKALSPDPEKRFVSAAAMAAEVRRVVSTKLPMGVRVASAVRETFADAIQARRRELERGEVRSSTTTRRGAVEELPIEVAIETLEVAIETEATHAAPTAPPPGIVPELVPDPPSYASAMAPALSLSVDDERSTTAAAVGIATSPFEARGVSGPRATGLRGVALVGGALVVMTLVTWLLVSRGSDVSRGPDPAHGAARHAESPGMAQPIAAPEVRADPAPASQASAVPTPPEPAQPAVASHPSPPAPTQPAAWPAAGPAQTLPVGPGKRRPAHGYDPEGI
jgi:hypothetical protein